MEIVIDFAQITSSPVAFAWWFFTTIGWIIPVFLFVWALLLFYQAWIRNTYRTARRYILLAIDVPKNNEQSPKAVENMFNHLAGAHQPLNFYHKWWIGEIPDSFSFEIISNGGYIQFLVHTMDVYRDLIEAMVYAQYPDAEITQVEDYTKDWKLKFPNDQYKVWVTEFVLTNEQYFPIKTYEQFEHVGDEEPYKDSMAGLLEAMGRIGLGEQIWIQFVTTPADNDWGKPGKAIINKLIGAKIKGPKSPAERAFEPVNYFLEELTRPPTPEGQRAKPKNEFDGPPNKVLYMTEGEKNQVKAIGKKIDQQGFHVRTRFIYLAEKDKYKKTIPHTVYGAFKQFNDLGLNGFKPDKRVTTAAAIWFKNRRYDSRRRKILYRYKHRGHWLEPGYYGKILTAEELATVWHFPSHIVKAPLVQKTEAKRGEPPIRLPITGQEITEPETVRVPTAAPKKVTQTPTASPPENLPVA